MKRVTAIILSLIMIISLCACGSTGSAAPREPEVTRVTAEPGSRPDDGEEKPGIDFGIGFGAVDSAADEPAANAPADAPAEEHPSVDIDIPYEEELPYDGIVDIIPLGDCCWYDLDGDGVEEEILAYVDGWNLALLINGEDYTAELIEQGLRVETPDTGWYGIVDLDMADGMLDIALVDSGPSDDYITQFVWYRNGYINYSGLVPGMLYNGYNDEITMGFDGDGRVYTQKRMAVLQTWWAPSVWYLGDGGLMLEERQELYFPEDLAHYTPDGEYKETHTLLMDVCTFTDRGLDCEYGVLYAGEELRFIATDNDQWVLAETDYGERWWLWVPGGFEVQTPYGTEFITQVFEGLCMAD